jgi:saccharopine dehydrogenase-like NADP-dependent oxidoreductase
MQVAVIGAAGNEGSGIIRDILSKWSESVDNILAIDRNFEKLENLRLAIDDARVVTKVVDATNKKALVEALKGVQACINAANYTVNINVMTACLETRTPYLDLGGMYYTTLEQKKLHEKFIKKGVPAVLGMGSAPGCTNILVKYAADKLDTVEKVNLYDASKVLGPESPLFIPPYSIKTLLREFSAESIQYISGEFRMIPAGSGKEVVEFPEPLGKVECVYTLHSEIATLPFSLKGKGVKEVTWKLGLPDNIKRVVVSLVACGFGVIKELRMKSIIINPEDLLEALIQKNIQEKLDIHSSKTIEESQSYEIIRARVVGKEKNNQVIYTMDLIQEPQKDYRGINDPITAIPASIVAEMLARGEIPPGAWAPEECIDAVKCLIEMKKRKFKINIIREESLNFYQF